MSTAPVIFPDSVPGPAVKPRHPIFTQHFRRLWIGVTISQLGDQFYLVALPWLVLQLTGSSLALGTILMTAAIPRAALMLVGGAVTDRVSPRRVLMMTASSRAVLVGTVAALIWFDVIQLWELYVLTFAFGVADAFAFPAGAALMPTLVEPGQLPAANSLLQSTAVTTQILGPPPVGLAIKSWGIASGLFLDAVSFLAVLVAMLRIPDPAPAIPATPEAPGAPARPGMLKSIGEGLSAVRKDAALRSLILVSAMINICVSGPIGVGLAAVAKFRFGSVEAFGILLTCFSAGALAGMLTGGLVKRPRKRGLQLIVASGLGGLEMIAIGLVMKLYVIAALLAVMGFGVGFVNVQFSAWMQMRVERSLLGRVSSVMMFTAVGLIPLSYAAAGFLAQWSLPGLFITAGALLAVTSALALTGKAAREID
jgi:hypothetical protein